MRRFSFIDAFKGFGVFFVILGHMPIKGELYSYIFSFQLAIFYFVGGFLYRDAHMINSFWDYLIKKIKRILIPYFVLSFISGVIYILYSNYLGKDYDLVDIFMSVMISKRNDIYINVPLWFLTSFFTIEIMYYILRCIFPKKVIGILVFIFGYIGVVILRTTGSLYTLPWTFDASLYFIIYYFLGDLFSSGVIYSNRNYSHFFRSLFLVFAISIPVNIMNLFNLIEHADIIYYDFGFLIALTSYLFHVFISLTGVFTYLFLSYILKWVGILKLIGKNSLYYFSLHMPIYYIFHNEGIFDKIFPLEFLETAHLNLIGNSYTIVLIIVITPIVIVINMVKGLLNKI